MGGINMWGNNILEYYKSIESGTELIPVPFDRTFYVQETTSFWARVFYGLKDYRSSIDTAIQKMKEGKIDVLHLCTSAQLSLFKDYYLLRKAKSLGIKTVIHFHFGRIPSLLSNKNWEGRMFLRVCNISDSIIVMDLASYNTLTQYGLYNVCYLPNPLSLKVLRQIDELKGAVDRQPNKILFVGHVIQSKGVFELVSACSELSGIDLHIVGKCDEKTRIKLLNIAQRHNHGEWLHLRGCLTHSEVIKEMMSSGIFALPSYTEGFPNVVLESMAASCAVIATGVGAIPEMLEFHTLEPCGVEIRVRDVSSIKHIISDLVSNKDIQLQLGRKARQKVIADYSMPSTWEQLQRIWINTSA